MTATVFSAALVILLAIRCTPRPPQRMGRSNHRIPRPPLLAGPVRTRAALGLALALLAILLAMLLGPFLVIGLIAIVLIGPPMHRRRARRVRERQIQAALPDMIELLMLLIHAGSTPSRAVRDIGEYLTGPLADAVSAVTHRLDRGARLADALDELPGHLGSPVRPLVEGIAGADRYGLPMTPVLDRITTELRASRQRAGEAHARTMSVRLSFPLVVCTLPSFILLAIVPAVMGAVSSIRQVGP